jgi:acetylornithine deacetylase/succinyl-diaminopimelate desuccinylase-like protein
MVQRALDPERLDQRYLIDTLVQLLKVPTEVPLGPNTLMEPDDPKLLHYVQEVVRPELQRIGVYGIIDAPLNQLVVRFGEGTLREALLIQVYTPTQHFNFMAEPFSGRIAIPPSGTEPCAFGQGASQNKAHMAAVLAVLKFLVETGASLPGTLYIAVNNEGRSSHACTEAILSVLEPKPTHAILAIGTGMKITAGYRGRVDIYVRVDGKACHSSDPTGGLSAIDGAYEVMTRLRRLKLEQSHPRLGPQNLVPYQVTYDPIAPHTLPGSALLKVDRRLLPGENISDVVEQVRSALADMNPYKISVEQGVYMLPALVDEEAPVIRALRTAGQRITGQAPPVIYPRYCFDAGGLTSVGIPAVMFGASSGGGDSSGIYGDDFVSIRQVIQEAKIFVAVIDELLSAS